MLRGGGVVDDATAATVVIVLDIYIDDVILGETLKLNSNTIDNTALVSKRYYFIDINCRSLRFFNESKVAPLPALYTIRV